MPVCASNRINTPEAGRGDPRRRRGRPGLDGPAAAGRRRVRQQGRRRVAPTRSTPASPATRPASTTCSRTRRRPAWSTRAPAARPTLVLRPDPSTSVASPWSAPGPAGLAAAVSAAERGLAVTLFEKSDELGGQFRLAMQIPGKEEFAETLRYYTPPARGARRRGAARHRGDGRRPRRRTTTSCVATGVKPRIPALAGRRPPEGACRYADVLGGRVVPGRQVAVIGAGGIGVDVSHFLTHDPQDDLEDWMAHWGVGDPALHRGGLDRAEAAHAGARGHPAAAQDHADRHGLGKTSGWAHRAVLKHSGVAMVSGRDLRPDRRRRPPHHVTVDGERPGARGRPRRAVRRPGVRARPSTTGRPGATRTSSAARTSPPSSTPSARSSRAPRSPPPSDADSRAQPAYEGSTSSSQRSALAAEEAVVAHPPAVELLGTEPLADDVDG